MVDFDFGDFIGDVAGQLGVNDETDLAAIAAKGIVDGAARIKDSASAQGQNPPVVTPTAYVKAQLPSQKVLGLSLTTSQLQILKVGGVILVGVLAYKMFRRK